MTVEADVARHEGDIRKIRDLVLENSELARSTAQSFEEVVVPAIVDLDTLEDRVDKVELRQAKQDGAMQLIKIGGAVLAAIGILIEMLRATGRL